MELACNCLVTNLVEQNFLDEVDLALAQTLLEEGDEEEWLFLAFLSLASRLGNLCIEITDTEIRPNIAQVMDSEEVSLLTTSLRAGGQKILKRDDLFALGGPLRKEGPLIYFQKHWLNESETIRYVDALLHESPTPLIDHESLRQELTVLVQCGKLLPEQAETVTRAAVHCLSIITGGPGTGKTYTAGHLIRLLIKACPNLHVALAAPTGKAAANLHSSLTKALKDETFCTQIPSTTLHRLLQKQGNNQSILSADVILVDECSMMDAELAKRLLALRKPGSRLILLGDKDQLPPVEAGCFFADLVAAPSPNIQEKVSHFSHCLRAELRPIIEFAQAVKEGDVAAVEKQFTDGFVKRMPFEPYLRERRLCYQNLLERFEQFIPSNLHLLSPKECLAIFNQFRILSPLRKGPFGVDMLNHWMMKVFQQKVGTKPFIAPIIVIKNDSRLQLYNGEVGLLVQDEAFFPSAELEGEVRAIPAMLLPPYEFAYCLSVHKSQGSEFDHVLLLLPPGSETFGREILYTAVTRAKKGLEIWGDSEILSKTLKNPSERITGFSHRLTGKKHFAYCSETTSLDKI